MSSSSQVAWRRVGVMGLGRSGRAAAGFLARRGVAVIAADAKPREALSPGLDELEREGVDLRLGPETTETASVFRDCEAVIASPGVSCAAAPLREAVRRGIPVLAEVELAARFLRGVIIGITGSNGKSTVTMLAGRMLREGGIMARVCGNIGTPMTRVAEEDLDLPEKRASGVHYVVELSSFQLEGIRRLRPHVAVLLNLSPDHQDRYRAASDYFAAKARIFMNQTPEDYAVVNWDDPAAQDSARGRSSRLMPFSLTREFERGAFLRGDELVLRHARGEEVIARASGVPLRGRHNLENVLAAAAAAACCGAAAGAMAAAVSGFAGLPHRLEFVREAEGVSYYNDSKATNVGAVMRALEAFTEPLVLLLGGRDKGGNFETLRAEMGRPGRLRALVTFGEAGPGI
ncbi:MAG: UDP-N-acetylmuramoyl-L-alanine--D-glutamate ligase, partial [Acidobacteriota bacterium]